MTIEVLEPGALTTVQDPVGRRGWRHLGVPMGGAADRWSARLANRLVGNAEADAGIEFTLSGPVLQFEMPSTVALVGRFDAAVDGLPLAPARARALRAGSVVRIASGVDARGYLAIAGERFGRDDLATASYHMGIGNLENVIRAYAGASEDEAIAAADTLLLTVPNQLGVDYCAHVIDTVVNQVAPELGWR